MKQFFSGWIILASIVIAPAVSAKDYFFGMGYHQAEYEDSYFSYIIPDAHIRPGAVHLKLSRFIRSHFSIQAQFLMNAGSYQQNFYDAAGNRIQYEYSLEQAFSIYTKQDFVLPFARSVSFYSLAGIGQNELRISDKTNGGKLTLRDSGFTFGFGFEHKMADQNYVYLEYLSHPDDDDYDLTGINLGMGKRF